MTIIQIIDAFTFYGADVILLAAITCFTVQLLKKTLFKRVQKKVITFLPFILGGALYAAYYALYNMCIKCLFNNYVYVLEHGFSVGTLSTVIYVWYEQFIRGGGQSGKQQSVIAALIEGYVPCEAVEKTAREICLALEKDVTGDGATKAAQILASNGAENVSEADIKMLARLIIETLAHMLT